MITISNKHDGNNRTSYYETMYEFHAPELVQFLDSKQYVLLQLEPDFLGHACIITDLLRENFPATTFDLMADTNFAQCCTDHVSAAHKQTCHGILRLGKNCGTLTSRFPVYYLNRLETPLQRECIWRQLQELTEQYGGSRKDLGIVVSCNIPKGLRKDIQEAFACDSSGAHVDSVAQHEEGIDIGWSRVSPSVRCIYLTTLDGDQDCLYEPCCLLAASLAVPFYLTGREGAVECTSQARRVKQRPFLCERIKEARSFGIIITSYADMAMELSHLLCQIFKAKGTSFHVLSIGKLNPCKVANFHHDIDVFVLVGCPTQSAHYLKDAREYSKPLVLPIEIVSALYDAPCTFCTGNEYSIAQARKLLSEHEDASTQDSGAAGTSEALIPRAWAVAKSERVHEQRTYFGLDPRHNMTAVQAEVIVGKHGVASGYEHEKKGGCASCT